MMTAATDDPRDQFELNEAFSLINSPVVAKTPARIGGEEIPRIGVVVGVLDLNEEVEVVVKFVDRISQFTKREFAKEIQAISRDTDPC